MKCEVCGTSENIAGVCSSSFGPMSLCYCQICLAMGAEPKFGCQFTYEYVGISDGLTYFDTERDNYVDFVTNEIVPIVLKDGREFKTRTEYKDLTCPT